MFITVVNGKRTYRMSEIMRQAWLVFRTVKCSFSDALKRAWATAKSVMREILAVEETEIEKAAAVEEYKRKIDSASSVEEIDDIMEDDDMDADIYCDLLDYACKAYKRFN